MQLKVKDLHVSEWIRFLSFPEGHHTTASLPRWCLNTCKMRDILKDLGRQCLLLREAPSRNNQNLGQICNC